MNPNGTVWLASGSPRRRQILTHLGFSLDIRPADVDETPLPNEHPVAYTLRVSADKARSAPGDRVVLAADTTVHMDDRFFHKPESRDEAREHLLALSGRTHLVSTGVCVRRGDDVRSFAITSDVTLRSLDEREIDAYLATGEADDKAGAYGIQGLGGMLVAHVNGSWTNIMGLPAEAVVEPLLALGATRW